MLVVEWWTPAHGLPQDRARVVLVRNPSAAGSARRTEGTSSHAADPAIRAEAAQHGERRDVPVLPV